LKKKTQLDGKGPGSRNWRQDSKQEGRREFVHPKKKKTFRKGVRTHYFLKRKHRPGKGKG